jgi:hypothetical protein
MIVDRIGRGQLGVGVTIRSFGKRGHEMLQEF